MANFVHFFFCCLLTSYASQHRATIAANKDTSRNLVLASADGLSVGNLVPFVESVQIANADVFVFSKNLRYEVEKYFKKNNIKIWRGEPTSDAFMRATAPHNARFEWMHQVLSSPIVSEGQYQYVLATDVTDVVFQADPFAPLARSARAHSLGEQVLVLFAEATGVVFGQGGWNDVMAKEFLGPRIYERLLGRPVSCSGVILGTLAAVREYTRKMVSILRFFEVVKPVDQVFHNYLYHTGMLGSLNRPKQSQPSELSCGCGARSETDESVSSQPREMCSGVSDHAHVCTSHSTSATIDYPAVRVVLLPNRNPFVATMALEPPTPSSFSCLPSLMTDRPGICVPLCLCDSINSTKKSPERECCENVSRGTEQPMNLTQPGIADWLCSPHTSDRCESGGGAKSDDCSHPTLNECPVETTLVAMVHQWDRHSWLVPKVLNSALSLPRGWWNISGPATPISSGPQRGTPPHTHTDLLAHTSTFVDSDVPGDHRFVRQRPDAVHEQPAQNPPGILVILLAQSQSAGGMTQLAIESIQKLSFGMSDVDITVVSDDSSSTMYTSHPYVRHAVAKEGESVFHVLNNVLTSLGEERADRSSETRPELKVKAPRCVIVADVSRVLFQGPVHSLCEPIRKENLSKERVPKDGVSEERVLKEGVLKDGVSEERVLKEGALKEGSPIEDLSASDPRRDLPVASVKGQGGGPGGSQDVARGDAAGTPPNWDESRCDQGGGGCDAAPRRAAAQGVSSGTPVVGQREGCYQWDGDCYQWDGECSGESGEDFPGDADTDAWLWFFESGYNMFVRKCPYHLAWFQMLLGKAHKESIPLVFTKYCPLLQSGLLVGSVKGLRSYVQAVVHAVDALKGRDREPNGHVYEDLSKIGIEPESVQTVAHSVVSCAMLRNNEFVSSRSVASKGLGMIEESAISEMAGELLQEEYLIDNFEELVKGVRVGVSGNSDVHPSHTLKAFSLPFRYLGDYPVHFDGAGYVVDETGERYPVVVNFAENYKIVREVISRYRPL